MIMFSGNWLTVLRLNDWFECIRHKNPENVVFVVMLKGTKDTIVRMELNPGHGHGHHPTVFSGSVEPNENPEQTMFRELEEEAGYTPRQVTQVKPMGFVRPSKHMDMVSHLFLVFVEGKPEKQVINKDARKGGFSRQMPLTEAFMTVQDPCFHATVTRAIGGREV